MNLEKQQKKLDETNPTVGLVLMLMVFDVLVVYLNAFALMTIYNWFIPTTLPIQPLTFVTAVGVLLVFTLLKGRNDTTNKTPLNEKIAIAVMRPVVILALAYFFKLMLF